MSVGKMAKRVGISSVAELSRLSGTHAKTLYRWRTQRPKLLECIILGAAIKKQMKQPGDAMPDLINTAIRGDIKLDDEKG